MIKVSIVSVVVNLHPGYPSSTVFSVGTSEREGSPVIYRYCTVNGWSVEDEWDEYRVYPTDVPSYISSGIRRLGNGYAGTAYWGEGIEAVNVYPDVFCRSICPEF